MEPVIELRDIHRSFQKHFWHSPKEVLIGVSLTVMKGEVFGLLGPNGAGKTTFIKIVTGILRPTSGQVRIFCMNVNELAVKKRIGFLPEAPYFYEHLTGYEFLRFHEHLSGQDNDRTYVYDLIEQIGLKDAVDIPLHDYSRGMLQRIGFAQTLIGDPDLLILDEPLSGLDPVERKQIKDRLILEKKKGKTIFFTSHLLPDVDDLCDRIGVIQAGRIIKAGDRKTLLNMKTRLEDIVLEQWIPTLKERS